MNSVLAALIVFVIRAVFVLGKKVVAPRLWGIVFLASLCPLSMAELVGLPANGAVVNMMLGSSFKLFFFIIWEGLAAVLILRGFYRCRRRKWMALESLQLEDDVYILEDLKRPVICGFFHPMIYLPADMEENRRQEVIRRKRKQIAGGGQKLMVAAILITYLNWFNPILWLSAYYLKEDYKRITV